MNAASAQILRHAAALHRAGRLDQAAGLCRSLLESEPGDFQVLMLAGIVSGDRGDVPDAAENFARAAAAQPRSAQALRNLAIAQERLQRYEPAAESWRGVLALEPDAADAHRGRGNALLGLGRYADAVGSYRRALALDPRAAAVHNNLAAALARLRRYDEAIEHYRIAQALAPDNVDALAGLIYCRLWTCDWHKLDRPIAALVAAVRDGKAAVAPFTFLMISDDPADQLACATRAADSRAVRRAAPDRDASPRIRLGYLSADFHDHATAHLMAGLFECHDRGRFETFAYDHGPDDGSKLRRRLKNDFEHFVAVGPLGDEALARRIADDRIDILVDLKGHTANGRLNVLALRPAPVQAHYLGYPGTTGAAFVDYLIVDRFVVPPGSEPFYSEQLVYLADCYQVNDRGREIPGKPPTRAACGLPDRGFVFCCFNNNYKIAPDIFAIWMRLLQEVPGSVLWLLSDNPGAEDNLRRAAVAAGIAPARLVFAPRAHLSEHMARHALADLFLDTLPLNAHTTASDALWAGVPVLTCPGRSFGARVAGSLLHAAGLPELVVPTLAAYEAAALRLAREPQLVAGLKAKLAAARRTAPLFDTDATRRQLEAAYATMWQRWQRGEPPRSFAVPRQP